MISSYRRTTRFHDLGQSLIEVLAALVIVCLLAHSLFAVYGPVSLWVSHSRRENAANNYALSILESLRLDRDKLNPSNQGKSAEELELNCIVPGQDWSSELTIISPVADSPNLYEVEVSVEWNQGSQTECKQMSTLIRKQR